MLNRESRENREWAHRCDRGRTLQKCHWVMSQQSSGFMLFFFSKIKLAESNIREGAVVRMIRESEDLPDKKETVQQYLLGLNSKK